MEIVARLAHAAMLSVLGGLMSWMLLKVVHGTAELVRALRETPRSRRSDSWRHHMDPVDMLGVMGIGLVIGVVDLAGSPSARDVLWPMVIYLWLVGLVLVGLNGTLGMLYDRRLAPAEAREVVAATTPPPAADEYNLRVIASCTRFVDAFRPDGAPEYYHLLYGRGDTRCSWFTPSPEQLARCLREYDALLTEIAAVHPMYAVNLLGASEVCLGYVDRAWRAGLPLPAEGRSTMATLADMRVRLAGIEVLQGDWRERMWAILAVLEEMAAGRPPQHR